MASFNQVPLSQTTIAAVLSVPVIIGSEVPNSPVRADLTAASVTGNLGQATQYLQLVGVEPKWRREIKTLGG
jgi:hypothetical protein